MEPLLAENKEFSKDLRPDVLDAIRDVEQEFRKTIREEIVDRLPDYLAQALQSSITEIPASFILSLRPFLIGLSAMKDVEEMQRKEMLRQAGKGKPGDGRPN